MSGIATPGYKPGFYSPRRGVVAKHPSLWDGCISALCPSLGATGARLFDWSDFGRHAAITGASFVASEGKTALDFNGNNVSIPSIPNFGTSDVTFSAWIFYRVTNTETPIFSRWTSPFAEREFYVHITDNVLRFDIPFIAICVQGVTTISTGWSHVAVTRRNQTYTTYINGRFDNQTYTSNTPETGPTNVSLGFSPANSVSLNGQLDDLRIYDQALLSHDIRLLASRRAIAFELSTKHDFYISSSPVTGSLSVTLGAASLSASGTITNGLTGSLTQTLADASLSSSATLVDGLSAALSTTLDAVTLASTGTLVDGLAGTLSKTLDTATLSSTGTVANGLTGSLTKTLDDATLDATGSENAGLSGSLSKTLDGASLSATGTVANGATGSLSKTLGDCTLSATASFGAGLTAELNAALDAATVSSSGTLASGLTANLSVQLASASLAASGVVGTPSTGSNFKINVGGVWKQATPFVNVGGVWKQATPFIKIDGEWK